MYTRRLQFGFGGGLTPIVKNVLIANVALFVLQLFTSKDGGLFFNLFALRPAEVTSHFAVWQLVTYMFLHGSFMHIFFNMFTLWMFGCEVERGMGSINFLRFYFLTGLGAAIFHMVFNWGSSIPVIGASGAVYGVLVAFAVMYPNRVITLLLFFVLPISIKAKYLVAIFVSISLIAGIQGQLFGATTGVAHLAHLGGAIVGFIILRHNEFIAGVVQKIRIRQQEKRIAEEERRQEDIRQKRTEVDRILDKINEVGYEKISEKEKRILKEFSEYLSRD